MDLVSEINVYIITSIIINTFVIAYYTCPIDLSLLYCYYGNLCILINRPVYARNKYLIPFFF